MLSAELLARKYPAGARVKLIESRLEHARELGLGRGSLGTVVGHEPAFGSILVKWDDNEFNVDLIPGCDRFSLVFGR